MYLKKFVIMKIVVVKMQGTKLAQHLSQEGKD
jgi:hypothetical protein